MATNPPNPGIEIFWNSSESHGRDYKNLQLSIFSGLRNPLDPWSRAARKSRENEEMKRKWRKNEEMDRDPFPDQKMVNFFAKC